MSALATEGLFDTPEPEPCKAKPCRRGTSNSNARGGSESRRRRRAWLLETYRADVDVAVIVDPETGDVALYEWTDLIADVFVEAQPEPACRCYRCGLLLVDLGDRDPSPPGHAHRQHVTADRIVPGVEGGTYKRTNIRPACGLCNERTGQALGMARRSA